MKPYTQSLKTILLALILSFGISFVYAWTGPTATPPAGNTSAPINTGTGSQYKNGWFTANYIETYGDTHLASVGGNVGIGIINPIDKITQTGNTRMRSADSRIIGLNNDNAYSLGISGGAAIRFLTGGIDDEIAFETHKSGASHAERMRITSTGNVGVGTVTPVAKLEVVGGITKTTGGLIIETRTSDPASPATGQMWLRTDL